VTTPDCWVPKGSIALLVLYILRTVAGAAMERSDNGRAVRQHCGGDGAPNYGMQPTAFGRG
jgi:hypothetical protein